MGQKDYISFRCFFILVSLNLLIIISNRAGLSYPRNERLSDIAVMIYSRLRCPCSQFNRKIAHVAWSLTAAEHYLFAF